MQSHYHSDLLPPAGSSFFSVAQDLISVVVLRSQTAKSEPVAHRSTQVRGRQGGEREGGGEVGEDQ